MEPVRRKALIDAAIGAIGERGSLDVTMSEIASRPPGRRIFTAASNPDAALT